MDDAMDIETPEPRGTKRTAEDAELAPSEQRRIRVRVISPLKSNVDRY
jgi:DNA mismatch repair protein MLH1